MAESFLRYVARLWLSPLPVQLARAILVAALFELLVWIIGRRIRRALQPALNRDVAADPIQRAERRRILLGLPLQLTRGFLYTVAVLIILRIFGFRAEADLYPIALAAVLLVAVAFRKPLRDAAAGYLLHLDYACTVGDEITVGEHTGMVSGLGLRHLHLRTRDGREIAIPCGEIYALIRHSRPKPPAPPLTPEGDIGPKPPPKPAPSQVIQGPPLEVDFAALGEHEEEEYEGGAARG